MAKATEELISIRAYARDLNVSDKAVRNAIAEGKIKKGVDPATGKIIPSKANKEWGSIHLVPRPQRGVSKAKAAEKLEAAAPPPAVPAKATKSTKPAVQKPAKKKEKPQDPEELPEIPLDDDSKPFNYQEVIASIRITSDLPYSEVLRRKEILAAVKERQLLEEKNGTLVRREDVDKALYKLGDLIKKKILNTPARCIADIRAAENEIDATNILTQELQAALTDIVNMKYDG